MDEYELLKVISRALNDSEISNELCPGVIYVDTSEGTYAISVNKCETDDQKEE